MKKGFTLVEVLVSIAVFTITFGVILTSYIFAVKSEAKVKDYTYFENICLNINEYYDKDKDNISACYGIDISSANTNLSSTSPSYVYFDSNYNVVSYGVDYKYILTYYLDDSGYLVISIYNNYSKYYIIENLNYGEPKA